MTFDKALEYVRKLSEGDYAECGVYQGNSAALLLGHIDDGCNLYLFDTFSGHPYHSEFDAPGHCIGRYGDTSTEFIFKRFGGDKRVSIVPGKFEDTLYKFITHRFRYVNLDCDLYQSYRTTLQFFLPRMVNGGIIRIDDYRAGDCPGCKKAVDEIVGDRLVDGEWILQK